jgi:hypothetical protein
MHFFRWGQVPEIWRSLGHAWQPFGGSGYLVLVALLIVASMASLFLILLPLALRRDRVAGEGSRSVGPMMAYFGCIGVAYLTVEIPLIQHLVLLVDHPTIAFAVVVSVLLITSGVGSLVAPRMKGQWAIPLLLLYLVALLVLLSQLSGSLLAQPPIARLAIACVLLVPLGLLMGTPFPIGIALLRARSARLIPWAWGVNGCASVVASILSPLIALEWGFSSVLTLAAVSYATAWLIVRLAQRSKA